MKYKSIPEVLQAAKKRRLYVNNCFELSNGLWRANFRTKPSKNPLRAKNPSFYSIYEDKDILSALRGAYRVAKKEQQINDKRNMRNKK